MVSKWIGRPILGYRERKHLTVDCPRATTTVSAFSVSAQDSSTRPRPATGDSNPDDA